MIRYDRYEHYAMIIITTYFSAVRAPIVLGMEPTRELLPKLTYLR